MTNISARRIERLASRWLQRQAGGLSKGQVLRLMAQFRIPGEVTGSGAVWEVELPDEAAKRLFERKITTEVGGYKTGFGAWVLGPAIKDIGEWSDPSSAWHYAGKQAAAIIVGDIFVSSWGYDQTNIDYYQVVKVSNAMVSIRRLDKMVTRRVEGQDYVMPKANVFIGPVLTRKVLSDYAGKPKVKVNSHTSAYKWDGKPEAQTAAGYGH